MGAPKEKKQSKKTEEQKAIFFMPISRIEWSKRRTLIETKCPNDFISSAYATTGKRQKRFLNTYLRFLFAGP